MVQKSSQQGCKLITGTVPLVKRESGVYSRIYFLRLQTTKVWPVVPSHSHPARTPVSTTETSLFCCCHVGCLKDVSRLRSIQRCFGALLGTRWMSVCGESAVSGCWQHETLDLSVLSGRSAAAHFIWKSMQQNAVNCQTSDFGSCCYTQNSGENKTGDFDSEDLKKCIKPQLRGTFGMYLQVTLSKSVQSHATAYFVLPVSHRWVCSRRDSVLGVWNLDWVSELHGKKGFAVNLCQLFYCQCYCCTRALGSDTGKQLACVRFRMHVLAEECGSWKV